MKILFVITDEDITEAAPQFTLIEEDDIDINVEDDILVCHFSDFSINAHAIKSAFFPLLPKQKLKFSFWSARSR